MIPMIVAIPTDDGVHVSDHFGRCRYFMVAEASNGKLQNSKLIENPHNKEESEGVGHGLVLKLLTDNKVRKVFCTNLGPRMEENLRSLKIEIERCPSGSQIASLVS
ncbi:MAG: NifB/NifX family molybdenum-iron cluster-binding protein [Thermoplasmata archaeon]